jgi:hypothetical protein
MDTVTDCRDGKDNKHPERAAAAGVAFVVAGDDDLLTLHPWRSSDIVMPAAFIRHFETGPAGLAPSVTNADGTGYMPLETAQWLLPKAEIRQRV